MSSWSSYPPRRSRSRSPRGGYSGRNYPDSYPEYRDWDGYDRDRNAYDRERGGYDYGRRGRSRSPPSDEQGRKRRRSPSPYDRERYDPRPRYDDYDAPPRFGHSTSPRRFSTAYQQRRPPPDPHTFDYPASLKQYAEWFRYYHPTVAQEEDNADKAAEQEAGDGSKPRNGIKTRWEKYKREFSATQLQTMFNHHRKSPWFAEKYEPSPEYKLLRARVRKEGWKGRLNTFLLDLEAGKFDPDVREPEPDSPSPTKETNGDSHETEDGKAHGDEDMAFNAEAEDDDRNDANGKQSTDKQQNGRGEEIAVPPEGNQVMIRTIPPDIGRVKLEESLSKISGFMYLALGDPLQKRNYYRAGWLRFRDDCDMTAVMSELSEKKIEGFKLHVTHNLKPFVNKIRFTPELASRPDRLVKDLANAKRLASLLEDEAIRLAATKTPPVGAPLKQLTEGENGDAAADTTMNQPEEESEPLPKERGSDAVERRIQTVMNELKEQGVVDPNDEKAFEAKLTVVSLDMYLAYLRAAFHTCYYCAVVTDHLEELQRKCVKHVRKPLTPQMLEEMKNTESEKERKKDVSVADDGDEKDKEKTKETKVGKTENRDWKRNDERWLEWLDSKIALLINREGVDPRLYGGKSYDEELSKCVEPFINQEDEGKYRCQKCQKLFKATSFVEKHIANKHPDMVKGLEDLPYFNNFALDPHRIQPLVHPPVNTGNSSQAPPQAYGLQPPAYYGDRALYAEPLPPGSYPPYYNPNSPGNNWGPYPPHGPPGSYPPPPRRDDAGRRLSDRISGFASSEPSVIPATAGLPPKPTPAALDAALSSGNGNRRSKAGVQTGGPAPPPPPDAKEDPRAAAGKRVSYHDMDLVAEGDVELMY